MSDRESVVVARFAYRHQAALAQAFLGAAGIDAEIMADDAGGLEVALSLTNGVRLIVREVDAARAREVLAAGEASGAPDQNP